MQPDSTLPAMVAFIKRRLVKTAEMGGQRFPALAETAERFNETSWFWTDDVTGAKPRVSRRFRQADRGIG